MSLQTQTPEYSAVALPRLRYPYITTLINIPFPLEGACRGQQLRPTHSFDVCRLTGGLRVFRIDRYFLAEWVHHKRRFGDAFIGQVVYGSVASWRVINQVRGGWKLWDRRLLVNG